MKNEELNPLADSHPVLARAIKRVPFEKLPGVYKLMTKEGPPDQRVYGDPEEPVDTPEKQRKDLDRVLVRFAVIASNGMAAIGRHFPCGVHYAAIYSGKQLEELQSLVVPDESWTHMKISHDLYRDAAEEYLNSGKWDPTTGLPTLSLYDFPASPHAMTPKGRTRGLSGKLRYLEVLGDLPRHETPEKLRRDEQSAVAGQTILAIRELTASLGPTFAAALRTALDATAPKGGK